MAALVVLGYAAVFFGLQDLEAFAKKYGYEVRDIATVLLPPVFIFVAVRLLYRLHKLESKRPMFDVGPLHGLSRDIDMVVQNMTGPVAVVSINYRVLVEVDSRVARQLNLQNRTLPPRDLDSDRIPLMQGQPGIFRLCRLNTDEDEIQFAVKTPTGIDWVSASKNERHRVEIDVASDPDSQGEDTYLFRLTLPAHGFNLLLQRIDSEPSSRKFRILERFRRKKDPHGVPE